MEVGDLQKNYIEIINKFFKKRKFVQ